MARNRKSSSKSATAGPVRLAEVLPQLIAKFGIQQRSKIDEINRAWKEIVGPPYDTITRVIGLNRGLLEIAVPHNAFVQELSFRQSEFLEKLRAATGNAKIKKVRFVVLDIPPETLDMERFEAE